MSNCCSHGTFLHFSPQSSHLCICYYHQDLHQTPFHPGSRHGLRHNVHALLLIEISHLSQWLSISHTLKRHPFSALIDSAGELLHTPQRISTSMTTVLLSISINSLCGIQVSVQLDTLTKLSVYPASPVLLTKNGPLGTHIDRLNSIKQFRHLTYLKFENTTRMFHPLIV